MKNICKNVWQINSVFNELDKFQRIAKESNETQRVFVGSMMDIFEKPMPLIDSKGVEVTNLNTCKIRDTFFNRICENRYPNLMFLLLTKRPSNINKYTPDSWKQSPPGAQHKLKASFKKYGINSHLFDILFECEEKELNEKEIHFIKQYDSTGSSGLNISHGGTGVMRNRKHSEETKEKIRIKKTGLKYSSEIKLKMSISRKKWKHTDESKSKMSILAKGKNTWSKGRKMSDDFKEKIKQSWIIRKQNKFICHE